MEIDLEAQEISKISEFFQFAFGASEGIVCTGFRERGITSFKEVYFEYPKDLKMLSAYCNEMATQGDVYFCTQLLSRRRRIKENIKSCPNLWADLDGCAPKECAIPPSIGIESSPGRFQGLWLLNEVTTPEKGEELSKRIAYQHAYLGCDKGGWALTKYLRVPGTYNYKYATETGFAVTVSTISNTRSYDIEEFEVLSKAEDNLEEVFPFPTELPDVVNLLVYKRDTLHPLFFNLYKDVPEGKWSERLWNLEVLCLEYGFTREETFAVAENSACNKYKRDGRSPKDLWKEVCKAWTHVNSGQVDFDGEEDFFSPSIELLTDEERTWVVASPTVVEDYVNWASTLSDAAWQFHEAGIFTILSSLLCGHVRLPSSAATLNLNLWFMILANTTLTRKSTAMGLAMGLLDEVDPDAVLATDGSIEGLFSGLSTRPGRSSIFLRDEVSGLLEQIQRGGYQTGLGEAFAKLYDGNREKRVLRKEVIEVKDPRLILFTGGVKNRVYELLDQSHVLSGFLPRFIFVTVEPNLSKLKPMGPPTVENLVIRAKFVQRLSEIRNFYADQSLTVSVNGQAVGQQKRIFDATLTEEAWTLFNKYADILLQDALKSVYRDLLVPTYDRLSKSGLKVATLIAATRMEEQVVVTDNDIIRGFFYTERWREYVFEVVTNLGKNIFEKTIDRVTGYIAREPGISRAKLMRLCQLSVRSGGEIFDTMVQRGILRRVKEGKTAERFYMIGTREMEQGTE